MSDDSSNRGSRQEAEEQERKAQMDSAGHHEGDLVGDDNDDDEEDVMPVDELFLLQRIRFELVHAPRDLVDEDRRTTLLRRAERIVRSNKMAPFYRTYIASSDNDDDKKTAVEDVRLTEEELREMDAANAATLAELDRRVTEAEEQFGESEVRDALLERAQHLHRIGDVAQALAAYRAVEDKTAGAGPKLDCVFARARIALATQDAALVRACIAQVHTLLEGGGGDWERRNRLKVYEGLQRLCTARDFDGAARLLLDSVSTFSCHELMTYTQFARYAVTAAALALDRPQLRDKVMECPELLAVASTASGSSSSGKDAAAVAEDDDDAQASHAAFMNAVRCCRALYECRYDAFLVELASVWGDMRRDMFLAPHARHYTREMRVRGYTQFLEPYRSVTLDAMAAQFGLSTQYVDGELARFIAAGRLQCKIDRVAGVVESSRHTDGAGGRNAMYSRAIRAGDSLIDRVQKLSRVIEM